MNTITLMKALCIVGIVFTAILLARSIPKIRSTAEGQARWTRKKSVWAWASDCSWWPWYSTQQSCLSGTT